MGQESLTEGHAGETSADKSALAPAGDGEVAQQALYRDIDAILARIETRIAVERDAMDGLLDRLSVHLP